MSINHWLLRKIRDDLVLTQYQQSQIIANQVKRKSIQEIAREIMTYWLAGNHPPFADDAWIRDSKLRELLLEMVLTELSSRERRKNLKPPYYFLVGVKIKLEVGYGLPLSVKQ